MTQQKTVTVKVGEDEFEFYASPTVRQEVEIDKLTNEIFGDPNLIEYLENEERKNYEKYETAMKQQFPNFRELDARFYELLNKAEKTDEEKEEEAGLYKMLKTSIYYARYLKATTKLTAVRHAATLEVLTVKAPENWSWKNIESDMVHKIYRGYADERIFFRKKRADAQNSSNA